MQGLHDLGVLGFGMAAAAAVGFDRIGRQAAAIIGVLLMTMSAFAHGEAEWIQRGSYRNAAGELCCGERDCKVTPATYVIRPAPGYVLPDGAFVPEREAQPSPDGQFWVCIWGGKIKCFFAPLPAM